MYAGHTPIPRPKPKPMPTCIIVLVKDEHEYLGMKPPIRRHIHASSMHGNITRLSLPLKNVTKQNKITHYLVYYTSPLSHYSPLPHELQHTPHSTTPPIPTYHQSINRSLDSARPPSTPQTTIAFLPITHAPWLQILLTYVHPTPPRCTRLARSPVHAQMPIVPVTLQYMR